MGQTKVNVQGIQPHELVNNYLIDDSSDVNLLVEAQWNEMKKQIMNTNAFKSVTAIVDVSSSMSRTVPMQVAIALGILVAECEENIGHGKVITFSEEPEWHTLTGTNLKEKVHSMKKAKWGGSTNMSAVFDLILSEAIENNLSEDLMVKTLFIFTDMQFNSCNNDKSSDSTLEFQRKKYQDAGYSLPNIICWNLRTSESKIIPVACDQQGVTLLAGFSAELLKCILNNENLTPVTMMNHILDPYLVPESIKSCEADLSFEVDMKFLKECIEKSTIKKAYRGKTNDCDNAQDIENFI